MYIVHLLSGWDEEVIHQVIGLRGAYASNSISLIIRGGWTWSCDGHVTVIMEL